MGKINDCVQHYVWVCVHMVTGWVGYAVKFFKSAATPAILSLYQERSMCHSTADMKKKTQIVVSQKKQHNVERDKHHLACNNLCKLGRSQHQSASAESWGCARCCSARLRCPAVKCHQWKLTVRLGLPTKFWWPVNSPEKVIYMLSSFTAKPLCSGTPV